MGNSRRRWPSGVHGRGGIVWIGLLLTLAGLAVGVFAGSVIPGAWKARDLTGLGVSALMVTCGACAVVAGGSRLRAAAQLDALYTAPSAKSGDEQALPRLGEILVHKYHLITEKDVQRALARQREAAPRPLGEILVDMGKITWRDLARALEEQLSHRDPWVRR